MNKNFVLRPLRAGALFDSCNFCGSDNDVKELAFFAGYENSQNLQTFNICADCRNRLSQELSGGITSSRKSSKSIKSAADNKYGFHLEPEYNGIFDSNGRGFDLRYLKKCKDLNDVKDMYLNYMEGFDRPDYSTYLQDEKPDVYKEIMDRAENFAKFVMENNLIKNSRKSIKSAADADLNYMDPGYFRWEDGIVYDKDNNHWDFRDYISGNVEPYATYMDAVKATADSVEDSFTKDEISEPWEYAEYLVTYALEQLPDPGKFCKEYEGL